MPAAKTLQFYRCVRRYSSTPPLHHLISSIMLRRYLAWGLGWAASGVLLAGCRSWPVHSPAARKASPTLAAKGGLAGDWPFGKVAEAHAHYAAGVIDEMNG